MAGYLFLYYEMINMTSRILLFPFFMENGIIVFFSERAWSVKVCCTKISGILRIVVQIGANLIG